MERNLLPYLRKNKRNHRPSNDTWIGNKSVSKKAWEPPLMWLVWEILRDLYRLPLTGKLHSQKEIYLCFKAASSGTCLVFASSNGFSTLPSKATVRESPPSLSKAPTMGA